MPNYNLYPGVDGNYDFSPKVREAVARAAELTTKFAPASGNTKAYVGLSNVDNTSDANKPVSTAQKAALDAKAPASGNTKAYVGLSNVDNTSDANKPVSVAQATAINAKADKVYTDNKVNAQQTYIESEILKKAIADNKSFTVERFVATATFPEYYITTMTNALIDKNSFTHIMAFDKITAAADPRESPAAMYIRKRPNVLINAGGWWGSWGRRMGLSIHEGVLIQDWDYGQPNWGVQAMVFYKDGSMRCEDFNTPGATLVANGAWTAMSQGKAAVKRGVVVTALGTDSYYGTKTGRQIIGVTKAGLVLFITIPGISTGEFGATGQDIVDLVSTLDFQECYCLDGGGSTQTLINGVAIVPSSDPTGERPVVDGIAFYGTKAYDHITTGWQPIKLNAGYTQQGSLVPSYMIEDSMLYLRGSVSGAYSGMVANIGTIPPFAASTFQYVTQVSGPGVLTGKLIVEATTGKINVFGPASGLTYVETSGSVWKL